MERQSKGLKSVRDMKPSPGLARLKDLLQEKPQANKGFKVFGKVLHGKTVANQKKRPQTASLIEKPRLNVTLQPTVSKKRETTDSSSENSKMGSGEVLTSQES